MRDRHVVLRETERQKSWKVLKRQWRKRGIEIMASQEVPILGMLLMQGGQQFLVRKCSRRGKEKKEACVANLLRPRLMPEVRRRIRHWRTSKS